MKRFWKWLKREPIIVEKIIVRYLDPAETRRRIAAAYDDDAYRRGWAKFRAELDAYARCCCRCRR